MYNYPASRLSLGLPVVMIIMCCSVYSTSNRTALFCPHRTKAHIIHTCDNTIAIRDVGIVGRLSMLASGPIPRSRACMIS